MRGDSGPSTPPSAPKVSRRTLLSALPAVLTLAVGGQAALADHTLVAAKVSFDRYHPRILAAIETVRQIGRAAANGDSATAATLLNDKIFLVKARRALSIYATSFSDNYLGKGSRKMLKYIDGMYAELELVAGGTDMKEHYNAAIDMLEAYYTAARLPRAEVSGLRI